MASTRSRSRHGGKKSRDASDVIVGPQTDTSSFVSDGWKEDFITLRLSQTGVCFLSEDDAPALDIPRVWH